MRAFDRHGARAVPAERARIAEVVAAVDYLRRSGAAHGARNNHKEWLHFCLHAEGLHALVNFSLVDDARAAAIPGRELGRLTVLVREKRWIGGVERYTSAETRAQSGGIDVVLGPSRVWFERGRYHIDLHLREHAIEGAIELEPLTFPTLANNIHLDRGPPINWVLVPRLRAWGYLTVEGRRYVLDGTLAYHDHNWGYFDWGRDFAWEWCYALPDDPTNPSSVAFVRLNNRARTRCYMQGLFLWDGAQPSRIFRAAQISVHHTGHLRGVRPTKIPQVMGLISPGDVTDVPETMEISAEADGDQVALSFQSADVAQVIIPNDCDDLGVTIINEVNGRLSVRGVVRGQPVRLEGAAMFELIRG